MSHGLSRSPPSPHCSSHLYLQSITPHCRACCCYIQAPGSLSPSPWQDPCPVHLSSTLPSASWLAPYQPLSCMIWNLFLKQGCLNPLLTPWHTKHGLQCPLRQGPTISHICPLSLHLLLLLQSECTSLPALDYAIPPGLSQKGHFWKSLFPTPLRSCTMSQPLSNV